MEIRETVPSPLPRYAVLVALAAICLIPFFWMIFGAFKTAKEINSIPPTFFPRSWTFGNFAALFEKVSSGAIPLGRYYFNSIFIAGMTVATNLFSSCLLGYVFAKFAFRGKSFLFWFIMSTMMIPFQTTMVPNFLLLSKLHLVDSAWGLIVPGIVSAYGIFLIQQFMFAVPDTLMDAARVDGAGEFRIFLGIILPQLTAAMVTLGLMTFIASWNSYLWPLIVLPSPDNRTLPVILYYFQTVNTHRLQLTMATSIVVLFPTLVVFVVCQRWIVKGFAFSGLKG
jgi:multiple sugar transport system permease protein